MTGTNHVQEELIINTWPSYSGSTVPKAPAQDSAAAALSGKCEWDTTAKRRMWYLGRFYGERLRPYIVVFRYLNNFN